MLRLALLYKVRLFVAPRVWKQTNIRKFIINDLMRYFFKKRSQKPPTAAYLPDLVFHLRGYYLQCV